MKFKNSNFKPTALNMGLGQKGFALIFSALVFELALFGILGWLDSQAEEEAAAARHSERISSGINILVRDIFDLASLSHEEVSLVDESKLDEFTTRIKDDIINLKDAVKDDPQKIPIVAQSTDAAKHTYMILQRLSDAYKNEGATAVMDELQDYRKPMRMYIREIVSSDLISMARAEEKAVANAPRIQAQYRDKIKSVLIANVLLGIAFSCILAAVFYKQIVRRLDTILDNFQRLSNRKTLNPKVRGDDEISHLDEGFHKMVIALGEAEQRERDMIENSVDIICSVDLAGKLHDVNPACLAIWGYEKNELKDMEIKNILLDVDVEHFEKSLSDARWEREEKRFEARIKNKAGASIDFDWSVRWVASKRLFFCVGHDISKRKEVERMKQEFLSMISHDLRTPLMTVSSYFELAETGVLGELTEKGKHLTKVAENNANRMKTLINDLLDIDKHEAGQLKIDRSNQELNELLQQSVSSVSSLAAKQSVSIKLLPTDLKVFADPHRILQVLVNLLSNAIKFSPAHSQIQVKAELREGKAFIYVSDQGRGVPDHLKEAIFDRFQQVEIADAVDKGGSGLGLAICKVIVELHGGKIGVESNDGKGSVFFFSLPLVSAENYAPNSMVEST